MSSNKPSMVWGRLLCAVCAVLFIVAALKNH